MRLLTIVLPLVLLASLGVTPDTYGAIPKKSPSIEPALRAELIRFKPQKGGSFQALLDLWEKKHGSRAAPDLLRIASDSEVEDTRRYIAVMGAAKLGGRPIAPDLLPLLRDRVWMVRLAALRAVTALGDSKLGSEILPLLKDKSLIVRTVAVSAVETLKPRGTGQALREVIRDPQNYHRGKPLWPVEHAQRAIAASKKK